MGLIGCIQDSVKQARQGHEWPHLVLTGSVNALRHT